MHGALRKQFTGPCMWLTMFIYYMACLALLNERSSPNRTAFRVIGFAANCQIRTPCSHLGYPSSRARSWIIRYTIPEIVGFVQTESCDSLSVVFSSLLSCTTRSLFDVLAHHPVSPGGITKRRTKICNSIPRLLQEAAHYMFASPILAGLVRESLPGAPQS